MPAFVKQALQLFDSAAPNGLGVPIRMVCGRTLTLVVLLCAANVSAVPRTAAAQVGDVYNSVVKPTLKARCFACHGALKQESGLRLDTAFSIAAGGESGAAVTPNDVEGSNLLARITAEDEAERMPPEGAPLTPEQIAAIREWIKQGAKGPANEEPEESADQHWAFQQPQRAVLQGPFARSANPLDALLEANRRQHKLTTSQRVERSLLLRRLYLDLIGLPPSKSALDRYLADDSPDAYERVVDRLLASPQFGERWGRHWMDVWRYSDWYGLGKQLRYSQKHIWRWRDWIVESLNEDKSYDEMVRLMLAADEIAPQDRSALRATGFLSRNYFLFNRTTWLDNTIEHTAKAFLALTVNCAKCHDHKYDAISQNEYYRFRAIFEPHQVRLDPVPGETDLEKDGLPRVFDAHLDAPTHLHIRGDEKNPDTSRPVLPGVLSVVMKSPFEPKTVALPLTAHKPALLPFVLHDRLSAAQVKADAARKSVAAARSAYDQALKRDAAAKARKTSSPAEPRVSPKNQPNIILTDEFNDLSKSRWRVGPGRWKTIQGKLRQEQDGASRAFLETLADHPRDFRAVLEFTTLGGSKWRSVGICFDIQGQDEQTVYLSSVQPGSKLQVSHKVQGNQSYPVGGKVDRPVPIKKPIHLQIDVKGALLNVAIDGKHALAYALPQPRRAGRLQLIAFDAIVEFDRFQLEALPANAKLVGAGNAAPMNGEKSLPVVRAELQLATDALRAAELEPAALETAFAAERAKLEAGRPNEAKRQAAIQAALALKVAQAQVQLAQLRVQAAQGKTDAKKLKAAEQNLLKHQQLAKEGKGEYAPIRASLKALEGPAETAASRAADYPTQSSGRRSALAAWITDRKNPLTARVAVNQIWLRHFGQPLVDPVTDFGRRTMAPKQQPLLDYLALELMDNGWSMKHLHRLIVTSDAYKLSTSLRAADPRNLAVDPKNEYYWRRLDQRMESQVIRDSLLQLANVIDVSLGGPSIKPKGQNDAAGRRSLYFAHSRDDQHAFLNMFDDADILRCYRRTESIVPQQALTLANSRLSLQAAKRIATALQPPSHLESSDSFVVAAFETILCRRPTADELETCLNALDELRSVAPAQDADARRRRARANFIHALLNHNDFITIR